MSVSRQTRPAIRGNVPSTLRGRDFEMTRRGAKTETLRAVHDDDLEQVLKALGVFEDVMASRTRCAACHDPVNLANLHAVFPDSGAVKVTCNKPDCIRLLLSRLEGQRYGD
jgi:hypothetical protein